jgi:hypothetical protein
MQSGSLARFLPAVVLVGIGIFSVAASFADDDEAPTFSKASFHAMLAEPLQEANDACGAKLQLTSDFESIDHDAWVNARESDARAVRRVATLCGYVLEAVGTLCKAEGVGAKWHDVVASQVKTIRCQFTDILPTNSGEGRAVWMKRNMSFAKGTFTVKLAPGEMPPTDQANEVLRKVLGKTSGAPEVPAELAERGESCKLATECGTNYCSKGVCAWCSKTNKCPKKLQCYQGGCMTALDIKAAQGEAAAAASSSSSSSASSSSKAAPAAKGDARGRMCGKPADCQSGICKMESKTRGRCQ